MKKGIRKPKLNTMTAEQIVARKKELLGHLKELRREVNYQPEKRKKKEKKSIDQIRKEAELRKKRLIAEMRRKMQGDAWDAQVKSGKFGSLVKTSQSRKKKRASGVDIRKFVALRKTRMSEVKHSDEELLHFGIKGMRWGIRRRLNNHRETRLLNKQDKLAKSNPKTPKQGMRHGIRRWLEKRKATQAQRSNIKTQYKKSRKELRKSLRGMKKEYRKGNGKIAFNENYRGLKGIRKAFNDRKTAKYLAETHGKDLAKMTLSKKMFKKAKKRYKREQVRAFKMERRNALKTLKFKGVVHSDYEVVLLHHGVLGQRWGIRRRLRNASLSLKSKFGTRHAKKMSMDDRFKKKLSKKRKISEMSDDELRAKIARMKLEGDYKKAMKDSGKGISGKINKILETQVGYTKDGKAKKLGPVLAEKLINTAFSNDEVNKALSSIATRGTKSLKSKLKEHSYTLSRKKKKGQWK